MHAHSEENSLNDAHDKQLERIQFTNDNTKWYENWSCCQASFQNTQKVYFNDVVSRFQPGKANEEDGKLSDSGGDDDCEADSGVAVVLEEGHKETKTSKQHHMDVNDH